MNKSILMACCIVVSIMLSAPSVSFAHEEVTGAGVQAGGPVVPDQRVVVGCNPSSATR